MRASDTMSIVSAAMPATTTPGSVTTKTRRPPASRDELGQATQGTHAEEHPIAEHHLELPLREPRHGRISST